MSDLKDKVVYITGGSKGIGYGIAKTLLNEGMRVAITSRNLSAARKAAESLSKDPSRILAIESEVGSMTSEVKAIQSVIEHLGNLMYW